MNNLEAHMHQPCDTRADTGILIALAFCIVLLHLLTNGRYGFHRDEWPLSTTRVTSLGDT